MDISINPYISNINNKCLVCGTPYNLDGRPISSRTTHSKTVAAEKLQRILFINDTWVPLNSPDFSWVICQICFDLLDKYDALEVQIDEIKASLSSRFYHSHETNVICSQNSFNSTVEKKNEFTEIQHEKINEDQSERNDLHAKKKLLATDTDKRIKISEAKESELRWSLNGETIGLQSPEIHSVPSIDSNQMGFIYDSILNTNSEQLATPSDPYQRKDVKEVKNDNHLLDTQVIEEEAVDDPLPETSVYEEGPLLLNVGERFKIGNCVTNNKAILYDCCYCSKVVKSESLLRLHVTSHHHPEVLTSQIPPQFGSGTKINCGVQLGNVMKANQSVRPFVCIYCDGAFKFKSNIQLHFKEKHTPYKPFKCVDCSETFRRTMELSRHKVYYCPHRKKLHIPKDRKFKNVSKNKGDV